MWTQISCASCGTCAYGAREQLPTRVWCLTHLETKKSYSWMRIAPSKNKPSLGRTRGPMTYPSLSCALSPFATHHSTPMPGYYNSTEVLEHMARLVANGAGSSRVAMGSETSWVYMSRPDAWTASFWLVVRMVSVKPRVVTPSVATKQSFQDVHKTTRLFTSGHCNKITHI